MLNKHSRKPRWRIRIKRVERCNRRVQQPCRPLLKYRRDPSISCDYRELLNGRRATSRRRRIRSICIRRSGEGLVCVSTRGFPLDAPRALGSPEVAAELCLGTSITGPAEGRAHYPMAKPASSRISQLIALVYMAGLKLDGVAYTMVY